MSKLLLFAILALTTIGMAAQNLAPQPAANPGARDLIASTFQTADAGHAVASAEGIPPLAGPQDNICYRIRAYVFRRDDDHAPKLVGSTTCGPRQPRARNATAHYEPLK
jgi:hypothetical protein